MRRVVCARTDSDARCFSTELYSDSGEEVRTAMRPAVLRRTACKPAEKLTAEWKVMRPNILTAFMLLLLLGVVARPSGVDDDRRAAAVNSPPPFRVGERAQFRASWGIVGRVGTGTLGIVSLDTVRGRPSYHAVFTIQGGIPGARVDERMETWLDQRRLFSLRFAQRTRYPRFSRDRTREFLADQRRWTGRTNAREESGVLPTNLPLDEIGFIYHARTMDLQVGREYTLDRYWNPEGNPVRLRVLRLLRFPGYNSSAMQITENIAQFTSASSRPANAWSIQGSKVLKTGSVVVRDSDEVRLLNAALSHDPNCGKFAS